MQQMNNGWAEDFEFLQKSLSPSLPLFFPPKGKIYRPERSDTYLLRIPWGWTKLKGNALRIQQKHILPVSEEETKFSEVVITVYSVKICFIWDYSLFGNDW